jgi:hypothetical protein
MNKQTAQATAPPDGAADSQAGNGAGAQGQRQHQGMHYIAFLKRLAKTVKPSSYLEIGTREGKSLQAFDCDAVCVDPVMRPRPASLTCRNRTFCFQMTSDRFFHDEDLFSYFPTGVDMAFLDGMHKFEYLLRDFINTERYTHPGSVLVVHDCFPPNEQVAGRVPPGGVWTGDVWKLVPVLMEMRQDLRLYMVDCPPTGLLIVQNPDRDSRVLQTNYHSILEHYSGLGLEEYGIPRLWSEVEQIESEAPIDENETVWALSLPTYG